jgi:hypothetical protein
MVAQRNSALTGIGHSAVQVCTGAQIMLGRCSSLSAHEGESMLRTYLVCRERERERERQTARGRSTQCTNISDPVTATSELLLRQNSVTAHAHRLASDHFATEPPAKICRPTYKTWHTLGRHKKNLHGLSPRANYTDRATATSRRSDCQLLRIEGATWSAWRIPTAVFPIF